MSVTLNPYKNLWGQMGIEVTYYNQCISKTLRGFVTVTIEKLGMEIRNISIHEEGNKRWIAMPSQVFQQSGQGKTYHPVSEFFDRRSQYEFTKAVLKAFDKFMEGDGEGESDRGNDSGGGSGISFENLTLN